jgi:DNA-binding XRE family transcriptional regulator
MVQDDKVSAVALSLGSTSSSTHTFGVGGLGVGTGRALGEVVGSASAMGPEAPPPSTPHERVQGELHGEASAPASELTDETPEKAKPDNAKTPNKANNVRKIRIERMMSKAELARRANLSVLTIDRVERGYGCRVDTKRKILEALGLSLADRVRVFGEEE